MIELFDVVRVRLSEDRRTQLQPGGQVCMDILAADGTLRQVTGIKRLQEAEDLRAYCLSPLEGGRDFLLVARCDFEFVEHGFPRWVDPAEKRFRPQLDLFGDAAG
jgi:hypothetical protein